MFPKIVVPPNHPILIGFSIIFTIHFGVFPLFLETPIWEELHSSPLDPTNLIGGDSALTQVTTQRWKREKQQLHYRLQPFGMDVTNVNLQILVSWWVCLVTQATNKINIFIFHPTYKSQYL